MAETAFSYKHLPIEPEIVEIGHGDIWAKVSKANLIVSSELYAKNVSKIGLKFDIPEITDRYTLDTVIELMNLNETEIPEEKWNKIRNILQNLECNDILKNADTQIGEIFNERAKIEEQKRIEAENPTISIFFKLNTGSHVIVKHIKANTLISDVKKMISSVTGKKTTEILFQHKDVTLPDEKTILQCGLTNKDVVTFIYYTPEYRASIRQKQVSEQSAAARAAPRQLPRPPVPSKRPPPPTDQFQNQNYDLPPRNAQNIDRLIHKMRERANLPPDPPNPANENNKYQRGIRDIYFGRMTRDPLLIKDYYRYPAENNDNTDQMRNYQEYYAPPQPVPPPPPKPVTTPPQPAQTMAETADMESAQKAQIIIILPNMRKIGIKLKNTSLKIEKLKEAVCKNTPYAPEKHKLVYDGVTMLDAMKLSDYKFVSGDPVYLLPK